MKTVYDVDYEGLSKEISYENLEKRIAAVEGGVFLEISDFVTKKYACEICRTVYDTQEDAIECESRPIAGSEIKVGAAVSFTALEAKKTGIVVECFLEPAEITAKTVGSFVWVHRWKLAVRKPSGAVHYLYSDFVTEEDKAPSVEDARKAFREKEEE